MNAEQKNRVKEGEGLVVAGGRKKRLLYWRSNTKVPFPMRATASIKLGLKKEEENAGKSLSEEKRLGPKWENGSCLVLGKRSGIGGGG